MGDRRAAGLTSARAGGWCARVPAGAVVPYSRPAGLRPSFSIY